MDDFGNLSIYLNRLENAELIEHNGKKCMCIPVDDNGIYCSQKGSVVLHLFFMKMYDGKDGMTHCVRRKLTKEEYANSTKDSRAKMPNVGFFKPYMISKEEESENRGNSRVVNYAKRNNYYAPKPISNDNEDIPF